EKGKASYYIEINALYDNSEGWEKDKVYALEENRGRENLGSQPGVNEEGYLAKALRRPLPLIQEATHLTQDQEEWERESKDTFNKFIYESEELDEKEGYYTLELEEELDIYNNLEKVDELTIAEQLKKFAEAATLVKKKREEVQKFFHNKSHLFSIKTKKLGKFLDKELRNLEKQGIIQKSERPWAFPVVIVPKKAAQEIEQQEIVKEKNKGTLPTTLKEKVCLLSLANLVYKEHWDQIPETKEYSNEGLDPGEETTEEYYVWIKELNQKFERVLTWSEHYAVEKSWWLDDERLDLPNLNDLYSIELSKWGESSIGVEFSDSESNWDIDWPYEVFIIEEENQCEAFIIQEEKGKEEGPEEPITEDVFKKLNERIRKTRASIRVSTRTKPAELMKKEVPDLAVKKQSKYANMKPTEAGTPKEEKDTREKKEEMEVFTVLVNDEDDDKTVEEEEDLPNSTLTVWPLQVLIDHIEGYSTYMSIQFTWSIML
ncbi:951_t:CDS:10, partial [Gigaspora rosea]